MNEKLEEMSKELYMGLFADRKTLAEAQDYAIKVINSFPASERIAAYTALHVVLNTISRLLKEMLEE